MCQSCTLVFASARDRTHHRFLGYDKESRRRDASTLQKRSLVGLRERHPDDCERAFTARFKVARQILYYMSRLRSKKRAAERTPTPSPSPLPPLVPPKRSPPRPPPRPCAPPPLQPLVLPQQLPGPSPPQSQQRSTPQKLLTPEYAGMSEARIRALVWRREACHARRSLFGL